jgi:hypothetical protein
MILGPLGVALVQSDGSLLRQRCPKALTEVIHTVEKIAARNLCAKATARAANKPPRLIQPVKRLPVTQKAPRSSPLLSPLSTFLYALIRVLRGTSRFGV